MADFMRVKYENLKLKQSKIANKLGLSSSTLQSYRSDLNMLLPYRIHPNSTNKRTKKVKHTNVVNNSHREHDLKRAQMTSNDLKNLKRLQMRMVRNWKQKTIQKVDLFTRLYILTINV